MSDRSDVITSRQDVSEVILGARVVARVFEARPDCFWWISTVDDSPPRGPFPEREDAEIDADIRISLSMDHAVELMVDT